MDNRKVIIIGGGLAGLTAAIHLSRAGIPVRLFEKNEFPKHKVCGEYISNEVLPYFKSLDIDIDSLHPVHIAKTSISTVSGKLISSALPLGGFGISRYSLDYLLYRKAIANGCDLVHETVSNIDFSGNGFTITTENNAVYKSEIVIGAFGKRANLDQKLGRGFIKKKSPWLAVKAHYTGAFPDDLVALHNFRGGYCGVSKVENDAINICYLADFETFKKYKNIEEYQENVLSQNPHLRTILKDSAPVFKPITISQVSFDEKLPVENHILMVGDTAGLIHPLCGNGMAMAIHSAKIASELIVDYFSGKIHTHKSLENKYAIEWNLNFRRRMQTGRFLATLLRHEKMSALLMQLLYVFPSMLPVIIKRTHGKPLIPAV
jgi:flavin-dependent dehydrogenase